jgi:hypothetical protein
MLTRQARDKSLKNYFAEQMDKRVTTEVLEKEWGINLKN